MPYPTAIEPFLSRNGQQSMILILDNDLVVRLAKIINEF